MDIAGNLPGPSSYQPNRTRISPNLAGSDETGVIVRKNAKTEIAQSKNLKHNKVTALLHIPRKNLAGPFKDHYKIITGLIWDHQADNEKIDFVNKRGGLLRGERTRITDVVESWDLTLLGRAFRAIGVVIAKGQKQYPETIELLGQVNKIIEFRNDSSHKVLERLDEAKLEESYQKLKTILIDIGYDEKDLDNEVARLLGKSSPCHNHPGPNTCFSGRIEVLQKLQEEIHQCLQGQTVLERTVVITGLMGMGKTEIAIQLAEKLKPKFDLIFWFEAETKQSLDEGFNSLWNEVFGDESIPEGISLKILEIYRRIHVEDYKAVFIFDNAEALMTTADVYGIQDYLRCNHSNTPLFIITSRNLENDWSRAGFKCVELFSLSKWESYECLLKHLRLERHDIASQPLKKQIELLVEELDGLALGLQIIGSEIYNESFKDVDYLNRFSSSLTYYTKLLSNCKPQELPGQITYAGKLGTIFSSIIEKIKKKDSGEAAEKILNIVGCLSPDHIYLGLVYDIFCGRKVPPKQYHYQEFNWENLESDESEDSIKFRRGMNILTPISLIKREKHKPLYTKHFETIKVHRMVQQCIRTRLSSLANKNLQLDTLKAILESLDSQFKAQDDCWNRIFMTCLTKLKTGRRTDSIIVDKSVFSEHIHLALSNYFSLEDQSEDLSTLQVLRLVLASEEFKPAIRHQLEDFLAKKERNIDASFVQPLLSLMRIYICRNDPNIPWDDMKYTLECLSPCMKRNYWVTEILARLAVCAWKNNNPDLGRLLRHQLMKLCCKRKCEELLIDDCIFLMFSLSQCEPDKDWEPDMNRILDAYETPAHSRQQFWSQMVPEIHFFPGVLTPLKFIISTGLFKSFLLAIPQMYFGGRDLSDFLYQFTLILERDVGGITGLKPFTNFAEPFWNATEVILDPKSPYSKDQQAHFSLLCSWCALFLHDQDLYSERGPALEFLVTNWLDTTDGLDTEWGEELYQLVGRKKRLEAFKESLYCTLGTKLWITRVLDAVERLSGPKRVLARELNVCCSSAYSLSP